MRCSVMLEHEPMYAVVLAFDVKIERDAQEFADRVTVYKLYKIICQQMSFG